MFILYKRHNSLNKRNLEGYYYEYFMQIMNLEITLLIHFCQKLASYMQVVIYA